MRDILINLFKDDIGGPDITLFGFFHLFYFFIILATTFCLAYFLRNKDQSVKKKILDIYAIVVIGLYFCDFLVHPFMLDENRLIVDKLPYHLCTISALLVAITRIFPNHTSKIKNAVTVLGLVGALMYLTCPNGAVGPGVKAFSYRMIQTFLYHGCLFTYGVLAICYGECKLEFKKIFVEAIMIASLILISLGANYSYSKPDGAGGWVWHYDWFFTTGASFGVSPYLMPFVMLGIIFAMCCSIYGLYYLGVYIINKKKQKTIEN